MFDAWQLQTAPRGMAKSWSSNMRGSGGTAQAARNCTTEAWHHETSRSRTSRSCVDLRCCPCHGQSHASTALRALAFDHWPLGRCHERLGGQRLIYAKGSCHGAGAKGMKHTTRTTQRAHVVWLRALSALCQCALTVNPRADSDITESASGAHHFGVEGGLNQNRSH